MARYPGARWRPTTRHQPGGSSYVPLTRHDGGVDHTFVGSPSSDAAFSHFNTAGNPCPHFMFYRDGSVDQYMDTDARSSACLDGNYRLITWETADGYPGLWSDGQAPKDTPALVASKAKLMVWLHKEHGIPLTRMPSSRPTARGMGWHRLGIDGNYEQPPGQLLGGRVVGGEHWSTSAGKTCPTSRRIHQFVEETLPMARQLADAGPKRIPKHALEHPPHGHPEYEGDSNRAIDHAADHDITWVDLNALRDKAGTVLNTHYPFPLRHGFTDPLHLLHPSQSVFTMTDDEWGRLRTVEGTPAYRIAPMSKRLDYAMHRGRRVEVDLKCILPTSACRDLLRGDDVWFKTMGTLNDEKDPHTRTPWMRLRHAKRAGGTTVLICPRPFMKVPKEFRHDIDYWRRFRPRFV